MKRLRAAPSMCRARGRALTLAGAFKTVIRQYSFSSELQIFPWNPTSTAAGLELQRASESPAEGVTRMEGPTCRMSDVRAWGCAFLSPQDPGRPLPGAEACPPPPGQGLSCPGWLGAQTPARPWFPPARLCPRHQVCPSFQAQRPCWPQCPALHACGTWPRPSWQR